MDGLARTAGTLEKRIRIGDEEFLLSTPTLRAWAALENELIAETNNILEQAAKVANRIPPDQRAVFWETAHREASKRCAFTLQDLDRLLPAEQLAVLLYLALFGRYRERFPSLQSVRAMIADKLGETTLDALREQVTSIVEGGLKNSPGPAEGREPTVSG